MGWRCWSGEDTSKSDFTTYEDVIEWARALDPDKRAQLIDDLSEKRESLIDDDDIPDVKLCKMVSLMSRNRLFVVGLSLLIVLPAAAQSDTLEITPETFAAAVAYSDSTGGNAVLVVQKGEIVYETYTDGYDSAELHLLASGSKSFSCAIVVAAIQDGYLSGFDELASETAHPMQSWRRARATNACTSSSRSIWSWCASRSKIANGMTRFS